MLTWVLMFLLIALVAASLGFTGIAGTYVKIAKVFFYVFLILFIITFIIYLTNKHTINTALNETLVSPTKLHTDLDNVLTKLRSMSVISG